MANGYPTRDLSPETWPDFERLFSQGGGWDFCACMLYPRGCHLPEREFPTRARRQVRNLQQKKALVEQGRTHGILVYAGVDPVGWCQYGRVEELPIVGLAAPGQRVRRAHDPTSRWRITCFVTHRRHRRQGVAGSGLAAALESIGRQGGGWVEAVPIASAYPHIDRRARELLRTYGWDSAQVQEYLRTRTWPEVEVPGVGPVPATRGTFGNVSHAGTVSLFERAGFEAVRIVGNGNVLMCRHV